MIPDVVLFHNDTVTEAGKLWDGYHTFDELYEHRIALWIALCRAMADRYHRCDDVVWKAREHSDGTSYAGWFVLGMRYEAGKQITYHLPESKWQECEFAKELQRAPEFDGHSPADVVSRLKWL